MKGNDLPSDDNIVRYAKPSTVKKNGKVDGSSFHLRPHRPDEKSLSVNWLEILGLGKDHQLKEARRLSRLELRPNGRFAELNVGTVRSKVLNELDTIRIVHDPLGPHDKYDPDPSHSVISGLPPGNSSQAIFVGDLIAECIINLHPAVIDK